MALVKFGGGIAAMSGKLGGTIFSRNGAGAISKNWAKPTYPGSARQAEAAGRMSTIVTEWQQGLTNAQRTAFNNKAATVSFRNRLGDDFTPSGFNLYVRANTHLSITGQAMVTAPPVTPVLGMFTPTLAHVPATGVQISAVGDFDDSLTHSIRAYESAPCTLSTNYFKGPWVPNATYLVAAAIAVPVTILPTAQITPDSAYFFRFISVSAEGGVSAEMIVRVAVGAAP